MSTADIQEILQKKRFAARIAREAYNSDPSPTKYSALQKALFERRLIEEEFGSVGFTDAGQCPGALSGIHHSA
ncbi:hypothetical protein [Marinobacter sp. F3R08]|uniref:hypothetical protein n=1 Tax=Marinobacter sp. F3R08 TaxID=2841559 RepID=UPI001C08BD53|nr:hypothetical protein [Marinobacter sp. F3R08]MBU2953522.1 hypothetical protein [Marinobacter sp. F3R08]